MRAAMRHSNTGRCSVRPVSGREPPRRAIALLLVLVIISIGSILAMRYLQIASTRSMLSQSFIDAKKAELLAESGLSEAAYWFRHPELTGGSLWSGVASRKPESAVADYYKVTVAPQAGSNPPRYTVTSEGHILAGTVDKMVRTVNGDFGTFYGFPDAVTSGDDLSIVPSVTIIGSVYTTRTLNNQGYIDGNASASLTILNTGTIKGRTTAFAILRTIGLYPVVQPTQYVCQSTLYTAQTITADNNTNAAWSSSGANPKGVWYRSGNVHLYGTAVINGTLVVSGDLHLCAGSTTVINPKPSFPAIVVKGNLCLDNDVLIGTINGTALVGNHVKANNNMPNSRLTIRGGLVFTGSGAFEGFTSQPQIIIYHDPTQTDVSGLYPSQPQWTAGIVETSYKADEP